MKRTLKRLLRPAAGPVIHRVGAAQRDRLDEHDHVLGAHGAAIWECREGLEAFEAHLPALLNTISSQNAAERLLRRDVDSLLARTVDREHLENRVRDLADAINVRIDEVERRLEFIRKELMYETRYGEGGRDRAPARALRRDIDVQPPPMPSPLRLNLGAGHLTEPGFVNVDARELDGIELVADVLDLPYEPGTVDEIRAAHLLEHFPHEQVRRQVLPHWFETLRPGGTLTLIVPDSEAMVRSYAGGEVGFEELRTVTFGDQEYDGDFHFTMFTPASLTELLERLGFEQVKVVADARRNGMCFECEVTACRPTGR